MAFNFLARFLQSGSRKRRAIRSRKLRRCPRLERLEDRSVPATFTWTGAASELWSNPANWAENRVPESGPEADIDRNDRLVFPQSATRFTSVNDIKGGVPRAAEVEITGDYAISGGSLRLDSNLGFTEFFVGGSGLRPGWSVNLDLIVPMQVLVGYTGDHPSELLLRGIISGANAIDKVGLGTLILDAANTYTGETTISEGTLEVRRPDALGATAEGTAVREGATLKFGPGSAGGTEALTVYGELLADADRTWAGPVTLATDFTPTTSAFIRVVGAASDLTLSGPVSGNAGLRKVEAGTLVFSGAAANSYTGTTRVDDGRLDLNKTAGVNAVIGSVQVGVEMLPTGPVYAKGGEVRLLGDNQIPNSVAITVGRGSLLNLNGRSDTVGELTLLGGRVATGAGTLTLNGNLIATSVANGAVEFPALVEGNLALGSATRTLTISDGPATTDATIAAVISGTAGLTKAGAGRLLLSGNNSYTGPTTVNAGRLTVDGEQPSSPVEVKAGGTLAGSGRVGPLTVRADAFVRPGDSLTVNGNATFGGFKSIFQPFVGTVLNGLGATGTLNLNNATLSIIDVNVPGALPPLGVPLPIAGAASVVGLFNGLPQNAIAVSASGLPYRVTYTPNNVFVTRLAGPAFPDRAITPVIDEGGVATLTGRITTTEPRDTFFLEVNWGDGTRTEIHKVKAGTPREVAIQHRYLDDGTYTVGLLWRDQRGAFNTGTLQIMVRNVAPTVLAGDDLTLKRRGTLTRHGRAIDPGPRDVLTATVDYGDGSGPQPLRLNKQGRFLLHHHYRQPGEYQVTVTVQDDDGAVGADSFRVTVTTGDADGIGDVTALTRPARRGRR
jgi:autotransporter-associated beta strand protein